MSRLAIGSILLMCSLAACGGEENATSQGGEGATGGEAAAGGQPPSTGGGGDLGGGGEGGTFTPDPIPDIDDEPPAPCPAAIDPGWPPQFLYDVCDAKRAPTNEDRELACPVLDTSAVIPLLGGGEVTYAPSTAPVVVDTTTLPTFLGSELYVTVVLIRRVNGVPHYRYLSNGNHDVAYQPWSTTKFLAAANAASTLRYESAGEVGLTASVSGHALGDLVTSIASYDYDPFSSNALGRYFHNVGGRAKANSLIHAAWLGRPATETFGGNYGEAAPDIGYTFAEEGGPTITIAPDGTTGPANYLSSFTMAEAMKRIVLHREEPAQRLPDLDWQDVKQLLYGAEGSAKGPFGGLSADAAVLIQSGHDIDYIEARSAGKWRIFGKLGNGTDGQLLNVGYGCFPVVDLAGEPVAGWGREFVIAAHLPTGGATWKERDRILARYYRAIIERIVDGRI